MTFDSILGQERAIRFLRQIMKKKRIPNAMLFTGIDGIGKQTTARSFGMALNCTDPHGAEACMACASCAKVLSGAHPDVIVVEPDGTFIKIDQVRAVSRQLRFAPLEGRWRLVIVNDAHVMNLEAGNAILKMLEEPPEGTVIILTATQTTGLLPTIVSRCQQIAFRPIPHETVAGVLMEKQGVDRETAETLALCSKGSLGKALSVDAEKWTAWRSGLLGQIASLSPGAVQPILSLAETLYRDKSRLAEGLDMMATWFRDVLMWQIAPDRVINQDFKKEIELAAQGLPVSRLLEKVEAVRKTREAISRNANPRLALEVMMIRLCSEEAPS